MQCVGVINAVCGNIDSHIFLTCGYCMSGVNRKTKLALTSCWQIRSGASLVSLVSLASQKEGNEESVNPVSSRFVNLRWNMSILPFCRSVDLSFFFFLLLLLDFLSTVLVLISKNVAPYHWKCLCIPFCFVFAFVLLLFVSFFGWVVASSVSS